jgi:hypothetical protein
MAEWAETRNGIWQPDFLYRLLHPFTWRKTQAAAIALMPRDDAKAANVAASGQVQSGTITSAGSGYPTPPAVVLTPPGSNH